MTVYQFPKVVRKAPRFIGYMRVSSANQDGDHISFDAQKACIRSHCKSVGAASPAIYKDIFTGRNSAYVRRGLHDAVKRCVSTGATLIVASVDRLGRSLDVAELVQINDLEVLSISEGWVSTDDRLVPLLEKAQRYSDAISRKSKAAHKLKRQTGISSGNIENLMPHRGRGAFVNKQRADDKVRILYLALRDFPRLTDMTLKEKVAFLNARGILNIKSTRTLPIAWTIGSLRKPLKAAMERLASESSEDGTPSPAAA
ncbi:recombinase family protein [Roseivivax sp. CAU 1753]